MILAMTKEEYMQDQGSVDARYSTWRGVGGQGGRSWRGTSSKCSFFFQAEDGIRDYKVTGVQTCALPICGRQRVPLRHHGRRRDPSPRRAGEEERRLPQVAPLAGPRARVGGSLCRAAPQLDRKSVV